MKSIVFFLLLLLFKLSLANDELVEVDSITKLHDYLLKKESTLLYFYTHFHSSHTQVMSLLPKLKKIKNFQTLLINGFEYPDIAENYSVKQLPLLVLHQKDKGLFVYDSAITLHDLRAFILSAKGTLDERSPYFVKKNKRYEYEAIFVQSASMKANASMFEAAFTSLIAEYPIYTGLKSYTTKEFVEKLLIPHFALRDHVLTNLLTPNASSKSASDDTIVKELAASINASNITQELIDATCNALIQARIIDYTQLPNFHSLVAFASKEKTQIADLLQKQSYIVLYQRHINISKVIWIDPQLQTQEAFKSSLDNLMKHISKPQGIVRTFSYKYLNFIKKQHIHAMILWVKRKHYSSSFAIQRFFNETKACYEHSDERAEQGFQGMVRNTLFFELDPVESEANTKLAHAIGLRDHELPKITLVTVDDKKGKLLRADFKFNVSEINYIAKNLLDFYEMNRHYPGQNYEIQRESLIPLTHNQNSNVVAVTIPYFRQLVLGVERNKRPIVVEITSHSCKDCLKLSAIIEELSVEFPNALFCRIDIELSQTMDDKPLEGIEAVPALRGFKSSSLEKYKSFDVVLVKEDLRKQLKKFLGYSKKDDEEL